MLSSLQAQAVAADGHVLISACPGSGKTTTLAHRAARLLRDHPGHRIAAVTFTNEAATELRTRILREVPNASRRVLAGTFHRLAKDQLIAAGRTVRLASASHQGDLLRRAFATTDTEDLDYDSVVAYIERVKSCAQAPHPTPTEVPLHEIYVTYQRFLRQQGVMDFADLLLEAVAGMESGRVPPLRVGFMLVDEFQDTDSVQLSWVLAHAANGTQITVVGDDDQSIYGWRNALGYQGMQAFLSGTRGAHVRLDVTYRCGTQILASAAGVIARNSERVEKNLRSVSSVRGDIELVRAASREGEAGAIASAIAADLADVSDRSWAVLARTNALLDPIEVALSGAGVPYRRVGGKSFWEHAGPSLFVDVLESLCARTMTGIDRVLAACGVGEGAIASLHAKNLSDAPGALDRFLRVKGRGSADEKKVVGTLREAVGQWLELMNGPGVGLALYGLADWMGCHVRDASRYRHLIACAKALARLQGGMAQRIALVRSPQQHAHADAGVATLMTLHACKGREFDAVWIAGCEEGVLPHASSPEEEERRLFYVGMTRARSTLRMSYACEDAVGSVFLREAGL